MAYIKVNIQKYWKKKRKNQVFTNLKTDNSAKYGMSKQSRDTTQHKNSAEKHAEFLSQINLYFLFLSSYLLLITYF